jgi:hypothetical protein
MILVILDASHDLWKATPSFAPFLTSPTMSVDPWHLLLISDTRLYTHSILYPP